MEKEQSSGSFDARLEPVADVFEGHIFPFIGSKDLPTGTKLYAIPEGWTLVPGEPTEEMFRAMCDPFIAINGDNRAAFRLAYREMLNVAPDLSNSRLSDPQGSLSKPG